MDYSVLWFCLILLIVCFMVGYVKKKKSSRSTIEKINSIYFNKCNILTKRDALYFVETQMKNINSKVPIGSDEAIRIILNYYIRASNKDVDKKVTFKELLLLEKWGEYRESLLSSQKDITALNDEYKLTIEDSLALFLFGYAMYNNQFVRMVYYLGLYPDGGNEKNDFGKNLSELSDYGLWHMKLASEQILREKTNVELLTKYVRIFTLVNILPVNTTTTVDVYSSLFKKQYEENFSNLLHYYLNATCKKCRFYDTSMGEKYPRCDKNVYGINYYDDNCIDYEKNVENNLYCSKYLPHTRNKDR